MRGIFWVLALFAAAVGLTLVSRHNTGYVLFVVQNYRVELSLNLLAVLAVAGFIGGYALVRLAVNTMMLPAKVRAYRLRRRRQKAQGLMLAGLTAFFEGYYARAEKAAAASLRLGEARAVNATVAARAAHELRAFDRRDAYLAAIAADGVEDTILRAMAEAEFRLEAHDSQGALQALESVRASVKIPPVAALRLELKARQQGGNWDAVLKLLGQLQKRDFMDPAVIDELRRYAHGENLQAKAIDAQALKTYWDSLPARDQTDPQIAAAAARAFNAAGECLTAHRIVENALAKSWDSDLVALYGECPGEDAVSAIEHAERWLRDHPDDPALLLTLGRLCAHQELWGKAKSYLEASLSLEPTCAAYLALAQLQEKLGESGAACELYRRSLELALTRLKRVTGGRRKLAL